MTLFDTTADGHDVHRLTITDGQLTVALLTYGARIHDVRLAGVDHTLTLGSDRLSDYEGPMPYYGALVGPIANRIGAGRITIDGMMYELERNQAGKMTLHSGSDGIHARVWQIAESAVDRAVLTLTLNDGDCGLPGQRVITATFTVRDSALHLDLHASTDEQTVMNIANHSLWNLDGSATWIGHSLQIAANHYLPTDGDNLVTGDIVDVTQTDMDFRTPREPVPGAPMLDHNFCLSNGLVPIRDIATLRGASGVTMTIASDRPGLQVFDNHVGMRPGAVPYEGFAMEPQDWPDAPSHRDFPSIAITPDKPYRQSSRWTFRQQ
ncbi:aldose epimerase family protein [Loktanella sp. SALINAS62]|uniref:aldose epimerase family protein n=1 Tax=Loktanella sp. SALINAS62 TaxID=2706124 RepID=UPI001B8D5277|nr:aldose epimerase family protein [Loktanella sp. SALINAS62]MBS1304299.1 galactose mutarotase [Loktanella sp. SALINAS62]